MSTRLTNDIRTAICDAAVSHAFDPRFAEMMKVEEALAREAYETVFTAEERKKASAIPANWLRYDACLRFNVGGQSITLNLVEPGVPVPYRPKAGKGHGGYGCNILGVIQHGDLCDRIQKHAQAVETYKEERRAAQRSVSAMLMAVTTTKRLREVWPEGLQFFVAFEDETARPQLPALRVDEINSMLGLSVAA